MAVGDPCMPHQPCQARSLFLACYAISLAQGQTLLGKVIKHATIDKYLKSAQALFQARRLPFKPSIDTDYVDIIMHAVKRYESVPNRRKMITDQMTHWLLREAKGLSLDHELRTILDWMIVGRYSGFRKSEWCQSSQTSYEIISDWPGQPPLAILESDVHYLGENEQKLPHTARASEVHFVKFFWRKQKNGANGESKIFARVKEDPDLCPVLATIRIIERAHRLGAPVDEPLAVFQTARKNRAFITDSLTAKHLRRAASAVLNIALSDTDLSLWSTHSIRVTAANLLHRQNFSDSFIMQRLRWKSLAFMEYLRDTIYSATQHSCLKISDSNLPPMAERSYRERSSLELTVTLAAKA